MKILMWNLQDFGDRGRQIVREGKQPINIGPKYDMTKQVNAAIKKVTTLQPDVFIIIEVLNQGEVLAHNRKEKVVPCQRDAGLDYRGFLPIGFGCEGLLEILSGLRTTQPNWSLVPPRYLSSSKRSERMFDYVTNEAIGVFYKSDKYVFTGPGVNIPCNLSTDEESFTAYKFSEDITTTALIPYPPFYANCIPATFPVGVTIPNIPPTVNPACLSGTIPNLQGIWDRGSNSKYPLANNWAFLTSFFEISSQKTYNLLSFHASKALQQNSKRPHLGSRNMIQLVKILQTLKPNEYFILAADLNDNPLPFQRPIAEGGAAAAGEEDTLSCNVALSCDPANPTDIRWCSTLVGKHDPKQPFCFGQTPIFNCMQPLFSDNVVAFGGLKITHVTVINPILSFPYGANPPFSAIKYKCSFSVKDKHASNSYQGLEAFGHLQRTFSSLKQAARYKGNPTNFVDAMFYSGFGDCNNPSDHLPVYVIVKEIPPAAPPEGGEPPTNKNK